MDVHTKLFINNEYVGAQSTETIAVYSPFDDSVVAAGVPVAGQADIDAAVDGALTASKSGPWPSFTAAQRAACMLRLANLIEAAAPELARLEHIAMGQPQRLGEALVASCANTFRYYAGWADKIAGETHPADDGVYKIVRYEPLGVCAGIGSWNSSHMTFSWKVAPALAAGNTIIYKSSEKSPLGLAAVGMLVKDAGFPPGVIQILSGDGRTGELLAAHMKVAKVSFTGSRAVGRKVQDAANRSNMKRCTLELGGKSPAIVFDDADLDNAVASCSAGFLVNSGQVCAASSRIYVQSSIARAFVPALKAAFQQAAAPGAIAPVADRSQHARIKEYIELGKREAEEVLAGGSGGHAGKGCFVEPTLLLNPGPGARVQTEEVFGPVATVTVFETEDEALALANGSDFGLSASIYTESLPRALRVSTALEAGSVGVNAPFFPQAQTPFGGYKESGQGRELGLAGLLAFLQVKSVHISMPPKPSGNNSQASKHRL